MKRCGSKHTSEAVSLINSGGPNTPAVALTTTVASHASCPHMGPSCPASTTTQSCMASTSNTALEVLLAHMAVGRSPTAARRAPGCDVATAWEAVSTATCPANIAGGRTPAAQKLQQFRDQVSPWGAALAVSDVLVSITRGAATACAACLNRLVVVDMGGALTRTPTRYASVKRMLSSIQLKQSAHGLHSAAPHANCHHSWLLLALAVGWLGWWGPQVRGEVDRCARTAPRFSSDGTVALIRINSPAQVGGLQGY